MYVCICNAVTDRDIVTAAARGARTSDDLAQDLGVGLGCGRCMADSLIERILFLEGLPNLQNLHKLRVGENVKEALACDLALEMDAHPVLRAAIAECESVGDYVTRDVFRRILDSEEMHIDWLETQLDLIGKVGLENYQQSQMGEHE